MKWILRRKKNKLECKIAGMEAEYTAVMQMWHYAAPGATIPGHVVVRTCELPRHIAIAKKELEQINGALS